MSRLRSSWDLGFSVKIGTVPPKSGRLDTLMFYHIIHVNQSQDDPTNVCHQEFLSVIKTSNITI